MTNDRFAMRVSRCWTEHADPNACAKISAYDSKLIQNLYTFGQ